MTIEQINQLIYKLAKRHKVQLGGIVTSHSIKGDASVDYDTDKPYITYNIRRCTHYNKAELVHTILHELKHCRDNHKFFDDEECEYRAEKYALQTMKRYYPKYYKDQVKIWRKIVRKAQWGIGYPAHVNAYKKLKEYK